MEREVHPDLAALEIPVDTLGLHTLYEPQMPASEIVADIVAVHGIGGDSYSTWTEEASGRLWLRDFLPTSPYFKNARIMTFGYDARVFVMPGENKTTGRIFTFGESLVGTLNDSRILSHAQNRPIIFVGHSLGGLVIKSALVYAQSRRTLYGSLYQSTKAILFFGTPHDGADVATWATYLGKISKAIGIRRAEVTAELQRWSKALVELSALFSEQIADLSITTFFEEKPIHNVLVVPEGSARLGQRNEVALGLDANHRSMCKFSSLDSAVYGTVKRRFEATLIPIMASRETILASVAAPTTELRAVRG